MSIDAQKLPSLSECRASRLSLWSRFSRRRTSYSADCNMHAVKIRDLAPSKNDQNWSCYGQRKVGLAGRTVRRVTCWSSIHQESLTRDVDRCPKIAVVVRVSWMYSGKCCSVVNLYFRNLFNRKQGTAPPNTDHRNKVDAGIRVRGYWAIPFNKRTPPMDDSPVSVPGGIDMLGYLRILL